MIKPTQEWEKLTVDQIDYTELAYLGGVYGYSSHILNFKCLFDRFRPKCFLEWGCGLSTKIFLDSSDKVISVEIIGNGAGGDEFLTELEGMFVEYKNWEPIRLHCTHDIEDACVYAHRVKKDYALVNPTYFEELDTFLKKLLEENTIDVTFVDAGCYIRGDLAEVCLQNNIPIVVAHDFPDDASLQQTKDAQEGTYVWHKVQDHSDYEKIHMLGGNTCFWIRKDLDDADILITELKAHALRNWEEKANAVNVTLRY